MLQRFHSHILIIANIIICCPSWVKSQEVTDAVDYNFKRGFYSDSFQLELTSQTPGNTIRYSLDGSKPTLSNDHTYSGPITIKNNTMVRAYTSATNFKCCLKAATLLWTDRLETKAIQSRCTAGHIHYATEPLLLEFILMYLSLNDSQ